MNEHERREHERNRYIRGYIIRSLLKGFQYSAMITQLTSVMFHNGIIAAPDISQYLTYLLDEGYVAFTNERITLYSAYSESAVLIWRLNVLLYHMLCNPA